MAEEMANPMNTAARTPLSVWACGGTCWTDGFLLKTSRIMEMEKGVSSKSLSLVLSLAVIIALNLIEIGYFVYSNYIFDHLIVTIGSAILVGSTLYSMIKFLPKIKNFISKPFSYLMERTQDFENILNYIMIPLEIVFCSYILVKVFIFLLNM